MNEECIIYKYDYCDGCGSKTMVVGISQDMESGYDTTINYCKDCLKKIYEKVKKNYEYQFDEDD